MYDFLKDILLEPSMLIVAHNFKFESVVIHEHFPELREALWKAYSEERLICTMVDEKIINNISFLFSDYLFLYLWANGSKI